MKLKQNEILHCDVLVIGSGGAGLRAAISARMNRAEVLLATKYKLGRVSNTYICKSIIAASGWGTDDDNKNIHMQDTIKGGRFLNDKAKVSLIAERIISEMAFLKESGVPFEMQKGKPQLLKIPGHEYPRHLHSENWTGADLIAPLLRLARQKGVNFKDHVFITRLMVSAGQVSGALGFTQDGRFIVILAKSVVLATGGYAQIYLNTNNAPGITGDGLALAYELGVAQRDMEFVQFYPTAKGNRGNRIILYERLLAQKGVALRNQKGADIISKYGFSDLAELTRDQLAQLIMKEIKGDITKENSVILDLQALSEEAARELGQLVPSSWWKGQTRFKVAPTAHFCMGGIATNQWGETSQKGLFAVGEVTGGAHGANRLGGNSLAEIFSMGSLVGLKAAELAKNINHYPPAQKDIDSEVNRLETLFAKQGKPPKELIQDLKTLMWDKAGIIREKDELEKALTQIQGPWPEAAIDNPRNLQSLLEFRNMRLIAELVCTAALQRTESRGSHYRIEHPKESTEWLKNIYLRKVESGMEVEIKAVN